MMKSETKRRLVELCRAVVAAEGDEAGATPLFQFLLKCPLDEWPEIELPDPFTSRTLPAVVTQLPEDGRRVYFASPTGNGT